MTKENSFQRGLSWTHAKFLALGIALSLTGGCEVPVMMAASNNQGEMTGMFEITFPAVMLVQVEGQEEELLEGQLIGHVNGSAKFSLTGPNWGLCTGGTSRDGQTEMTCTNGMAIAMDTGKQKPKMSGIRVTRGEAFGSAFVSAFGWGNNAQETDVRAAIEG